MDTNGITFRFIFYGISPESPVTGIRFLYTFNMDQLTSLIQYNKQYRIILVCKAEYIKELYNIIVEPCISEIFLLGNCTEFNTEDKKVTMTTTGEQDLKFRVLCAAVRYIHDDEMRQRRQENYGLANALSMDILKLLDQIEILL